MLLDPGTTITAIATTLKIVDSVTGQWDRFFKKREEHELDKPHRVTSELEQGEIVVKEHGKPVETITAQDVAKLDENSRKLIDALEKSMQRQYDLWTKVYPTRDASPDPVVNAQIDQRLEDIAKKMCADLGKLFRYLDSIGKYLDDHYDHVRFLCMEVEQSSRTKKALLLNRPGS